MIRNSFRIAAGAGAAALALAACQTAPPAEPVTLLGVACTSPPPVHCAETGCTAAEVAALGNAKDARTDRNYFLDYPCDLKPGEDVTFVLNLHGGGSSAGGDAEAVADHGVSPLGRTSGRLDYQR